MKIFIDCGHNDSGFNTGAVGNGLKEQDVTFNVAFLLSEILQKYNIETKLSRPTKKTNLGTNNSTSINTRYKLANDWQADYFISIHANAGGGTGAETLYHKPDSLYYATVIQQEYIKAMGLVNRGVKYRDDIGVIMHTKMPAVLIELAFIDTFSDALVLRDKQKSMAQAVANGFIELLELKPQEPEETEVRYNTVDEVPSWATETIKKLIFNGLLSGTDGKLDLSLDMIRLLVINDRTGLYD